MRWWQFRNLVQYWCSPIHNALNIQIPWQENNRDVPGTAIEVEDTHTKINSKCAYASPTVPTLNSTFGTAEVLLQDSVISTIPSRSLFWNLINLLNSPLPLTPTNRFPFARQVIPFHIRMHHVVSKTLLSICDVTTTTYLVKSPWVGSGKGIVCARSCHYLMKVEQLFPKDPQHSVMMFTLQ